MLLIISLSWPAWAGSGGIECIPSVGRTLDHCQVAIRVTRQQLPMALVQLSHSFRHAAVQLVHLGVRRGVLLHSDRPGGC